MRARRRDSASAGRRRSYFGSGVLNTSKQLTAGVEQQLTPPTTPHAHHKLPSPSFSAPKTAAFTMGSERAVAAALVDWFNSCSINPKIHSLNDLADGATIAKVLQDIDPGYFKGAPEHSGEGNGWLSKFQRLRKLHKDLSKYYTETLGHRLPSPAPNLTAIAKDANTEETIKLAKIIVATAVLSDRKEEYIAMIQELSPSSQTEMMNILNEMILLDQGEDGDDKTTESAAADIDQFRVEEELARLVGDRETVEAENKQLKRTVSSLESQLEEAQARILELQQSSGGSQSYDDRNDRLRFRVDELQDEVQKLEDKIFEKEEEISTQAHKISKLERMVDDLEPKAAAGMKYKDDLDEANHKIDKLSKAQNVAEKYRKKLESMGDLDQQMKTMEEQHARMFKDLRAAEESAKQVPGLKRTIEQYKKQVTKLEHECAEISRTKHALETEKQILLSKTDGAEYQKTRDQERIRNLEEKIRELESGLVAEAAEEYGGDLGSELVYSTRTKADMKLKIASLEAEIRHLKDSGGAGADNVVLKHMLEDATRARDKLEHDYLEANTAKLVAEAQLAVIQSGVASEGSEVMLKLRQNYLETQEQLSAAKLRISELEADLSTTKRALVTAQSDLSLVGKDQLETLDKLKGDANSDLKKLQTAHSELESKVKDLESDLRTKESLLEKVLLEKDALSTKMAEQKDALFEKEQALSDLKETVAAFEGSAEGRDGALEKHVRELQNKLEDRREKMTKSKAFIKKQNAKIKDLSDQLEAARAADSDEKLQAMQERYLELKKEEEELELLEREICLWLRPHSVVCSQSDAPLGWLIA
ncbi:HOOK protein-domain-containing protein [Sphaerosporella brunnea]|uniref:HOOK protein-domain-containing protein n=1 Tax=Sphaerosporella brunnea TaxID=1250544 RepID=A0A5J5F4D8_9PEZI|nr:HOOK protein-domain-containing protein [Sphaerosporella brunnea]